MNLVGSIHVPVMLDEVLVWLDPRPGAVIVDGTLGAGGHARALAERVGPSGRVIGLDCDPAAVEAAAANLPGLPIQPVLANFADLPDVLDGLAISSVDGVLLDLGMSSVQLADPQRGFSFDSAGTLDLRFDPSRGEPAWRLLDRLSQPELADLIWRNSQERFSRRIARAIVQRRRSGPIRTAAQLAEVVRGCVPRVASARIDPATRTFQALRIAVNDELECLRRALKQIPNCLRPGGRLAVISFHSLEDRCVKEAFRRDMRYVVLTKKPIRPSMREVVENPRARSAKLRVAERSDISVAG